MATREDARATPVTAGPSPGVVALVGLACLAVAIGIGRFAFTPILPMMQEDAGVTVAEGGWLASVNYLGYFLGSLSMIAVRMPPSAAIRLGLAAITATTLAMGFEHRFAGWLVLRGLAGVASAWILISVSAWTLTRLTPLRRPALNGTVFAGVGCGIAVAGGLCLALMAWHASSSAAWIGMGLVAAVVTAGTWPVVRGLGGADGNEGQPSARVGGRWSGDDARLVFCYGVFGFGYIIPATFLPVMARQEVQDPHMFGWAWPIFGLAAAASTFSATAAPRIGGNRRLWAIGLAVLAIGVSLPVVVPGLTGIMLAAVCVGGTFMVNTMGGMQEARNVGSHDATRLMAAMTAAFALGQIVGPLLVSVTIAAGATFASPLLVAAGVMAVAVVMLARSTRTRAPSRGRPG